MQRVTSTAATVLAALAGVIGFGLGITISSIQSNPSIERVNTTNQQLQATWRDTNAQVQTLTQQLNALRPQVQDAITTLRSTHDQIVATQQQQPQQSQPITNPQTGSVNAIPPTPSVLSPDSPAPQRFQPTTPPQAQQEREPYATTERTATHTMKHRRGNTVWWTKPEPKAQAKLKPKPKLQQPARKPLERR
jgi:TolA-binding protein